MVLDLRLLFLAFNAKLQLSGISRVEYWKLSHISTNIAVAILRVGWSTNQLKSLLRD
jgi:hypothetical protein